MDEPFYAAYLARTGIAHPMADEIIASGETDPEQVVRCCLEAPEHPAKYVYQKHMTHHMIDGFPLEWMKKVTNVFLIREPRRVLASYAAKREAVTASDTGFRRQRELFDHVREFNAGPPVVIDSAIIRKQPKRALETLCAAVGIAFDPAMLNWTAGPKKEDGVWGKHWYQAVWRSTGFAAPEEDFVPELDERLARIEAEVISDYRYMRESALKL